MALHRAPRAHATAVFRDAGLDREVSANATPVRCSTATLGACRWGVVPGSLLLAVLVTTACATVPPGQGAVVLAPSGVRAEPLGEGVSSIPWFGEISLYDLRQQQLTVRFTAITSDGAPVTTSASVVTYRIAPDELVSLARESGPGYAEVLVRPETESAVRQVVGGLRADELDTHHLVDAQAEVTRRAAARLRPYHVLLESVDLRTLQVVAPLALQQASQALALEQRVLTAPRELEIARQNADARREEGEGLARKFEALATSLSPEVLEDLRRRAWDRLLQAPSSSIQITPTGAPAALEVSP
jgi:regulator of protease activity HflC (stomatin/prohibitin superfamily)